MLKWIVIWTLSHFVHDPCPDVGKVDEFGRVNSWQCAALHGHYEKTDKYRIFENSADAWAFFHRTEVEAAKGGANAFADGISHVTIDSLAVQFQKHTGAGWQGSWDPWRADSANQRTDVHADSVNRTGDAPGETGRLSVNIGGHWQGIDDNQVGGFKIVLDGIDVRLWNRAIERAAKKSNGPWHFRYDE